MSDLPTPTADAIIYEDDLVYACLASYPLTAGHMVVVWKKTVTDLHLLRKADYEHLMWIVDKARDTLLKTLGLEKVYLMYLDEARHVHWHLVPRYNEQGYNVLNHHPQLTKDFTLASKLKKNWTA
ncbi:hypothetical protein BH23PAT2_BH23PAT2_07970 [soil metagenome]